MKKILLISIFFVISFLFTGCFLFEDDEIADAEMSVVIDEVVNINDNINKASENINIESINTNTTKTEEQIEEVENEELKLDEIFKGTWYMYIQYPELKGFATIDIYDGEYDSGKNFDGSMKSTQGTLYSDDLSEAEEGTPDDEIIDFEIDGQKIRFSTNDGSFYGRISLNKGKSFASGSFISTIGEGTWYMTNIKDDSNWNNL